MKQAWSATWPCDRFVFELLVYQARLKEESCSEQLQATLRQAQSAVGSHEEVVMQLAAQHNKKQLRVAAIAAAVGAVLGAAAGFFRRR